MEEENRTCSSYYPGLYQKSQYQRNCVKAALVAYSIIALAVVVMISLEPSKVTPEYEHAEPSRFVLVCDTVSGGGHQEAGGGGRSGTGRVFRDGTFPVGVIGHIKIVRDCSLPRDAGDVRSHRISFPAEGPVLESEGDGFGYGDSFCFFEIGGDGFGFGGDEPYLPRPRRPIFPLTTAIDATNKPATILFSDIDPTYIIGDDTGHLVVDLIIDEDGCIKWRVVQEEPEGHGYANAYLAMLLQSKFIPATRCGRSIKTKVVLDVYICAGCESSVTVRQGSLMAVVRKR